jgi:hypothetical protein
MTRSRIPGLSTALAILALSGVACSIDHQSSVVAPSPVTDATSTRPALLGVWTSQALEGLPDPKTCGNFQWNITTQTATAISGDFSAVCAGAIPISGVAAGQLVGETIPMTVSGSATLSGGLSCTFSLAGTGVTAGDTMTVPYAGTTCLGDVSGTATLHRSQLPWPPG